MSRSNNRITRWLALGGVIFGLGIQGVEGAESSDQNTNKNPRAPVSDVVKKNRIVSDLQLIPVKELKQDTSAGKERLYRPPQRGAPGGRVGGGTRGPVTDLPSIWVLAPDHVGLSREEQPQLAWYLSKPTTYPLEFTLIDEKGVTPILEKRLSPPAEAGIHMIRLADYGLKLEKGKTYQWFVSLISDPEHRSTDIISGGMIQIGDPPASLGEDLKKADPVEATRLWAQAGFWYDAISVISSRLQANPKDPEMHMLRASLLEEVNLDAAAQMDRQYGL